QKILDDRRRGFIRLPTAHLQRPESVTGRIHLATLTASLQIIGPISIQKVNHEPQMLRKFFFLNATAMRSRGGRGQDGDGLMMTGKAGSVSHVAGAAFLDQRQSLDNGLPNPFRRRHWLRGGQRIDQTNPESDYGCESSQHDKSSRRISPAGQPSPSVSSPSFPASCPK